MDKDVFADKIVGEFYNDKFISVKFQMDQTLNDNDELKKIYLDAAFIKKGI